MSPLHQSPRRNNDLAESRILQPPHTVVEKFVDQFALDGSRGAIPAFAGSDNSGTQSQPLPPPPPDRGLQAWSQVFMAHLVMINSWGYLTSFGIFQAYYKQTLDATPSAISWIGSIQIFLVYLIGTFSGRALDAGYYRWVLSAGCLLETFAVFMTSLSTEYWQLLLAQGICKGLGDGLVFCPTISLVATYFSKNRVVAMASAASGGATGGIIFPVIAQQLLPKLGFAWTVRIMAFVILFNSIVVLSIARVRLPPRKLGPLVEWSAFREPPYITYCLASFFNFWAVYFAYFYISAFGKDIILVSTSTSLTILLVMNAVGLPGRIVCGLIADRVLGPINTFTPVAFIAGIMLYVWAAVHSLKSLFIFCIIYGFFAAAIQSLFPAACTSLTDDLSKMGTRTGMCFSFISLACLTGPPIAGALIQKDNGKYLFAQAFGGSAFMSGAILLLIVKFTKRGKNWKLKV